MEDLGQWRRILAYEKSMTEQRIRELERRVKALEAVHGTIVIKKINEKLYYYNQWKEDGKLHSKSLGAVKPGGIARQEEDILEKQKLEKELTQQREVLIAVKEALKRAYQRLREQPLLKDFTFEVYWKDEITARVYVKGANVVVARFTDHPVKQLFAKAKMTRLQLDRVFRSRCWEEGRADNAELLRALSLERYFPQEIVRRTHGVSYNDFIWFRFPGENLTSKDVLVR